METLKKNLSGSREAGEFLWKPAMFPKSLGISSR